MFAKASRPVLIGVASIRLGPYWNLDRTEAVFEELLDEGKIRRITDDEKRIFDLKEGFVLVVT